MNNSNAAAKRRRAGIQPTTPPMPQTQSGQSTTSQSQAPPGGYTLPQVIALIDTRLITLENFMKETKDATDLSVPNFSQDTSDEQAVGDNGAVFMDSKEFTDFVEDINQRFQVFADEINGMKEIVLKLQGFTMDVNKMLLDSCVKNGEPLPNITYDAENETNVGVVEETFVLESSTITGSEGTETAVEKTVASGKNKRR